MIMARPKKHKNEARIEVKDRDTTVVLAPEPDEPNKVPGQKGKRKARKHLDVTKGETKLDAQEQAEEARKDTDTPLVNDAGGVHVTGEQAETKMYQGDISAESVSSETGEKISIRMHIPTPVTEEGVWYRFRKHHDSAMREHFKIDPENKIDPMQRTKYGG
jgi:hypothetical protein